jgi:hypothetical protein
MVIANHDRNSFFQRTENQDETPWSFKTK